MSTRGETAEGASGAAATETACGARSGPGSIELVEVPASRTYDLRRAVLRRGSPRADVTYPEDDRPHTFHLAALADGAVVAVITFAPSPCAWRPGRRSAQLRGMAVDPRFQGQGIGRDLLEAGLSRLVSEGYEVAWAMGRDTALGFYVRLGWRVVGEGYITPNNVAHHDVVLDLAPL